MSGCREEQRSCRCLTGARGPQGIRGQRGPAGAPGTPGADAVTDMAKIYTPYPTSANYDTTVGDLTPIKLNNSEITPSPSTAISFTNGTSDIKLQPGYYLVSYDITVTGGYKAPATVTFALALGGVKLPGSEHGESLSTTTNVPLDHISVTVPVVVNTAADLNLVFVGTPSGVIDIKAATVSILKLGNIAA